MGLLHAIISLIGSYFKGFVDKIAKNFIFKTSFSLVKPEEIYEKKVREILDRRHVLNLPIVEKNATIEEVLSVLTARNHIWVVESKKNKKICGVITESDVLKYLTPRHPPKYAFGRGHGISIYYGTAKKAEDIMHRHLVTASPDDTVRNVMQRMINYGLRRLPVVEEGKLIGEITIHYIIQILLGKR
ncbi:MAG: CBS domain-containing protein [Thermoplasmata archaeon]|nr:MAG: CBS domain-containing protein [Thermoplasmata archaeon]